MVSKTDLSLSDGQKYYRILEGEHSAILLTFIKLHVPFVIKTSVLSILSVRFRPVFTVGNNPLHSYGFSKKNLDAINFVF